MLGQAAQAQTASRFFYRIPSAKVAAVSPVPWFELVPVTVPVTRQGAFVEFDSASLDAAGTAFGTVEVGFTASKTVLLVNRGDAAATLTSIATVGPSVIWSQENTCPTTLAPGQGCRVKVTLHPDVTLYSGSITVRAYSAAASGGQALFTMTGGNGGALSVAPVTTKFGQTPWLTERTMAVTLTNSGLGYMAGVQKDMVGSPSDTYGEITLDLSGCQSALAPGSSCTANLVYRPGSANNPSLTLTQVAWTILPKYARAAGTGMLGSAVIAAEGRTTS